MLYNIKIKEINKDWEDISPLTVDFKTSKAAINFCNKLNELINIEVRLNEYGSTKGTYFNLFTEN